MLIFLPQRYKWNWTQCNIATVLKINQKCSQLVTIKISANRFSHNWANWSAFLTAAVMWAFLKPEITICFCLARLRWWYILIIHSACNGFMMLKFTSTSTSWAATPLFNCWRTFSADQSWYLLAMKHLALFFMEMSEGSNKFVWLFVWLFVNHNNIILFQQIIHSTRFLSFKHIKYQQRFCILRYLQSLAFTLNLGQNYFL